MTQYPLDLRDRLPLLGLAHTLSGYCCSLKYQILSRSEEKYFPYSAPIGRNNHYTNSTSFPYQFYQQLHSTLSPHFHF